jgi:hypothetical protein
MTNGRRAAIREPHDDAQVSQASSSQDDLFPINSGRFGGRFFCGSTEEELSELEKHPRRATTKSDRQTRFDEIDDVANAIIEQETEWRETKTKRLRALRAERDRREPTDMKQVR